MVLALAIRVLHDMADEVNQPRPAPSRRDAERALRELGLSARQAKRIIAAGWAAAFKDAGEADELIEALEASIARLRRKA